MLVTLKAPTGETKPCKVGFSWTLLFFWTWVPFFRGDFKWMVLIFLIRQLTDMEGFLNPWTIFWNRSQTAWTTFNLWGILIFLLPFLYNRIYIHGLLRAGWTPIDQDYQTLKERGFLNATFNKTYWNGLEIGAIHLLGSLYIWLREGDILTLIIANATLLIIQLAWRFITRKYLNTNKNPDIIEAEWKEKN